MKEMLRKWSGAACLPVLLAMLMTGCATSPKINWDSRVGNYTFDQAVLEMGPPDKSSDLQDGTRIAEWWSRRGGGPSFSFGFGTGFYGRHSAIGVGQSIGTGGGGQALRLTFGPDGKLSSWRRFRI
ncbi:MAG: hypothetical protein AB1813_05685 [Verrucomicrobiota bacterium]|jgi:hypothetical protein